MFCRLPSVWSCHNHHPHLSVEKDQAANRSLNPRWSTGWIGRRHTRSFKEPARTDFFQNKTKDERSKPKSKLRDHFKSTSIREEPGHRHEPLVQLGWALNQQEGAKWIPVWELDQITNPARWQNLPCSSSLLPWCQQVRVRLVTAPIDFCIISIAAIAATVADSNICMLPPRSICTVSLVAAPAVCWHWNSC